MNKKELNKKLKLYRFLGAERFQEVVFAVERLKFKALKTLCPNFIKYFDKYCDKKRDRELKNAQTQEEEEKIIRKYQFAKMAMRKEINLEQNRNYHMDSKKPTEIYKYLEWNKSVHKKGLIKNSIVLPLSIAAVIAGFHLALPIMIYELFSTFINFECVNIQNYNICRFKKLQPMLEKKEERQVQENIENYGEANEVIHKSLSSTQNLPSFEEIINNIKTPEQARQMREMLLCAQEERKSAQRNRGNK